MSHNKNQSRLAYETGIIVYVLNGEKAAVKWRNLTTTPTARARMLLKAKQLYPTVLHINFYHANRAFHYQHKYPREG